MAFGNSFEELDTIFFSWYLFVSGLLSLEFMPILRITAVGVWRGPSWVKGSKWKGLVIGRVLGAWKWRKIILQAWDKCIVWVNGE